MKTTTVCKRKGPISNEGVKATNLDFFQADRMRDDFIVIRQLFFVRQFVEDFGSISVVGRFICVDAIVQLGDLRKLKRKGWADGECSRCPALKTPHLSLEALPHLSLNHFRSRYDFLFRSHLNSEARCALPQGETRPKDKVGRLE